VSALTADITIVGLGPGDRDRLTIGAADAFAAATRIFVRSHPDTDFGEIFAAAKVTDVEPLRQPDDAPGGRWYPAALAVCEAAGDGPVAIAIPGHPRFGEGLVTDILRIAEEQGRTARVIDGISVIDLVATALGVDPLLEGVQCFAGRTLVRMLPEGPFAGGIFTGSPRRPMLFTHVYDAAIMQAIAASVQRVFPADHPVIRIDAAGLPAQTISEHTVGDLADVAAGPMVALWIPAKTELEAGRDPRTMQQISARLRRPEDGCPWDKVQTHETLRETFIDEIYEVLDAIDAGDPANLAEELGDLFLLITLNAQIAEESGTFTLEDVYESAASKIVRRHPHVFAGEKAETREDLARIWKRVKAWEKANAVSPKPDKDFDGEPRSKPSITRAAKVLTEHPLEVTSQPDADARSRALLEAVAAVVAAGDDPDVVLREALRNHASA